jgi:hypothetical protein
MNASFEDNSGFVGQAFGGDAVGVGSIAATRWRADSYQPGVDLSTSGAVSRQPSAAGTFGFTVRAPMRRSTSVNGSTC